ncbi:MAG TPA: PBSX family phage terminase large subunit [Ruminococcaceae bacterium]|nr:PBSX family phage terminase large subunit [Oscillospiraceae bacterium]
MFSLGAFSKKQRTVLTWWSRKSPYAHYDAIICDGAVRSGKTTCMSLSFIGWAFSAFSNRSFAICGRTINSLRRNLIVPLTALLPSLGFECDFKVSQNVLDISCKGRHNRFYLFGGKDEASASLIQGMTLAGVLLDEVALMPRSFVEQALARCSVNGSRFWFNCNPDHPYHWFYREWICKCEEKNALYLHFTMDDNPSLSKAIKRRYQSLYSGVFYERFVLGKWSAAEGLVYPQFDQKRHIFTDDNTKGFSAYFLSCDYGTVNPMSVGLWGVKDGVYWRLREFYYASREKGAQMTDAEYFEKLKALAETVGIQNIRAVIIDPSAASFIECIRQSGLFRVIPANNDVMKGIRLVSQKLQQDKIRIHASCTDILREFSLYCWDLNAVKESVKKENDHAMDDMRYLVATLDAAPACTVPVASATRN